MDTTTQTGAATRAVGFLTLHNDILLMLQEAQFAFVVVVLLIIADFRFGRQESAIRYQNAIKENDTYCINKYRWRTSRAIRRSINKLLDYILVALLGLFIGAQFLEPLNIERIWGTYAAMILIAFCEFESIISHFLFLHNTGNITQNALTNFLKKFFIIFAKKKNKDVGDALEQVIKEEQWK